MRQHWWVKESKLCLPVSDGTAECGHAIGRLGEEFYRLHDTRVIAQMRRIETPSALSATGVRI